MEKGTGWQQSKPGTTSLGDRCKLLPYDGEGNVVERRDNRKALPVGPFVRYSVEPQENHSELTVASSIRFRAL